MKKTGYITWADLTVKNAETIKEFYSEVTGWKPEPVNMGDYSDFNMNSPSTGDTITGICHAKGSNENFPPQWLIYITVEDVDESVEKCINLGGEVVIEARDMGGYGRMAVIKDPAGAVSALYSPAEENEDQSE